ncbi:DNA polymerase IV [Komagataeibacter saccharivorans]|uniref:DNA polymerase IV n=1 Tax=Komagataeibacter saccharivorans TaxID=265959 RepID=UPI000D7D0D11|nr:DNA polymerase IV [Komagataeibacter saccharivorans]PYD51393.1 DNA polymerase IV [Komagataeibacter saccharivorans]GBQ40219.1 DNA polymerase IV [Komagataeibacter saccharivorans NRIC 0614]
MDRQEVTRRIIHVDMDAFYASVEQRDNPDLRGRPLAVGGAGRRGVVAAASYEARRFGVRSAMPSVTAQRKCPDLVFVRPRFDVYRAVSAQIHAIFARFTPVIQPLSLDEAYLDVTNPLQAYPSATAIATAIRAQIHDETGLTASAGVSYNKFLAKLASDYRKPNGQFVITPRMGPDFVANLPVEDFHGIGPATAARMHALGIRTGLDLRTQPLSRLLRHFGKAADFYYGIARGIDERPVEVNRPRRSVGAERTFDADIHEWVGAQAAIADLSERVWGRCLTRGLTGITVTVKVKYNDFRQIVRGRTEAEPVRDAPDLGQRAMDLLAPCFPPRRGIRLLGVTVSGLREAGEEPAPRQLALFG